MGAAVTSKRVTPAFFVPYHQGNNPRIFSFQLKKSIEKKKSGEGSLVLWLSAEGRKFFDGCQGFGK
jgi:hypothetical protein